MRMRGINNLLQAFLTHSEVAIKRLSFAGINGALPVGLDLLRCQMFLFQVFHKTTCLTTSLFSSFTVLNRVFLFLITTALFLQRFHTPRQALARGLAQIDDLLPCDADELRDARIIQRQIIP